LRELLLGSDQRRHGQRRKRVERGHEVTAEAEKIDPA
jgi:hypothetical protein